LCKDESTRRREDALPHPLSINCLPITDLGFRLFWRRERRTTRRSLPHCCLACVLDWNFCHPPGVFVASDRRVWSKPPEIERRRRGVSDRRQHPLNGRRRSDPRRNWRRLTWLVAAYAAYVSLRWLPPGVRRFITRSPA